MRFSLDKPSVLNVLYDTLEQLGFALEHVDSIRGRMYAFNASLRCGGDISVTPSLNGRETTVAVVPDPAYAENDEWASALFDEMASLIRATGLDAEAQPRLAFHKEAL